jgi:hypothetical protein
MNGCLGTIDDASNSLPSWRFATKVCMVGLAHLFFACYSPSSEVEAMFPSCPYWPPLQPWPMNL